MIFTIDIFLDRNLEYRKNTLFPQRAENEYFVTNSHYAIWSRDEKLLKIFDLKHKFIDQFHVQTRKANEYKSLSEFKEKYHKKIYYKRQSILNDQIGKDFQRTRHLILWNRELL